MPGSPKSPNGLIKWLRRGAKLLLGFVGLVVLLALALIASLRLPGVRGAILGWAGSAIEESSGVHLAARDFVVHGVSLTQVRSRNQAPSRLRLSVQSKCESEERTR